MSSNWALISAAISESRYLAALINPLGVVTSVILAFCAFVFPRMRKALFLGLWVLWGSTIIHHFTLEGGKAEGLGLDAAGSLSSVGSLALFLAGFTVVVGVVIYFVFIRD